jgi:uncharacterized protein (TIGR02145 family)
MNSKNMNTQKKYLLIFIILSFVSCKKEKLPIVSTNAVINITSVSATSGVIVLDNGNVEVVARGIVWSESSNPTIENCYGKMSVSLSDTVSCTLSYLNPETQYYVRAYATHNMGTTYGNELSFTTLELGIGDGDVEYGTMTDSRDGNTYKTVQIGNQIWMAENLKYLPEVIGIGMGYYNNPYYYVYDYNGTDVAEAIETENYQQYGVLYNWYAAMNNQNSSSSNPSEVQGACPSGWHIPSDAEWIELENYLANNGYNYDETIGGSSGKIGKSLAATTLWFETSYLGAIGTDLSRNNKSGFSALPGGLRLSSNGGDCDYLIIEGHWLSSSIEGNSVIIRKLFFAYPILSKSSYSKKNGYSVRCVKD